MYASIRVGRGRIGGGALFWCTVGLLILAVAVGYWSVWMLVQPCVWAVRWTARQHGRHLTARQAP